VNFSSPTLDATRGRLRARFGARAELWWERLPELLAELAERWELIIGDAVGRGHSSLVVRCRRANGRSAVLKLTPEAELGVAEAEALRRWQSSGRVPLVWGEDATLGALLLEAIPSETPLSERRATVQMNEIVGLIAGLHSSGAPLVAGGVVSLAARVEFIFEHRIERHGLRGEAVTGAVPVERLRRGYDLAKRLVSADAGVPVLLHGDLHPGNVFDGGEERGLVAIDPRPCVGDAEVDVVDWVFWAVDDPRAWQPRSSALARALDLDRERLWAWCAAFAAMLAAAEAAHGASGDRIAALLALSP
jgi:streptomycin 6-kinase